MMAFSSVCVKVVMIYYRLRKLSHLFAQSSCLSPRKNSVPQALLVGFDKKMLIE
jgi:hypothetical protein